MPTTRTRTKRTRSGGMILAGRQIEHLLWGWALLNTFPFENDSHRRRAWKENRRFLLSLEGIERVPGVFGWFPLPKGRSPQAEKDYGGL